jgi:hypothetical protein
LIYDNEAYPNDYLLGLCFSLFFEYLNTNNYRAFVIWPDTIKDKETLGGLYVLFYSEMTKLNLELRNKFQPVEHEISLKKKIIIAKGMNKEEYLTIAKNAALSALNVTPDDLHFKEIQRKFYDNKLDDVSRKVVKFLMDLRDNIYDSQAPQSENESLREFREEQSANKEFEERKQNELRKKAKKLRTIEVKRKRNRNNPYPYCNYDYGFVGTDYDLLTGKKTLHFVPNLTPDYQGPKH